MTERRELQEMVDQAVHHYMGIMFEEFQHRLDLVLEKLDVLDQRMQRLEDRVQGLEDKVQRLDDRLGRLEVAVDQGFAFFRASFKNIERILAEHGTDIEALKKKVG